MSTKYNGPGFPMLHPKVHENWFTGSKEDFYGFYHIWVRKPSGHVTKVILKYFNFLVPQSLQKPV